MVPALKYMVKMMRVLKTFRPFRASYVRGKAQSMVITREKAVHIAVRIPVQTMERENEGSLKTYRYDSEVKLTGQNDT
jgi:hypothetical protein